MSRRPTTQTILRHWREAVPDDRLAHLVKDAWRASVRALQMRLAEHDVSFGHWTFLRILWEGDGLTQRELSEQAGVMEPTTFAALKAMERLGYIERRRHGGHERHPAAEGGASVSRPRCRNQQGRAGHGRCYAGAPDQACRTLNDVCHPHEELRLLRTPWRA